MARHGTSEQLRQQVLKLRGDGLSFAKIGQKLGISKAYAVKLANAPCVTAPPQPEKTNPTALTVRQQGFAARLLGGKSRRRAALDAGVPPGGADAFAQRTLKNPRFQNELGELLDRAGLSLEKIARSHAENLEATKIGAYATKDGKITDVLEVPDYAVRQRAVARRRARQTRFRVHLQTGPRGKLLELATGDVGRISGRAELISAQTS